MSNPTTISFNLPTTYTDGSALPATDLKDIDLLWGTVKGGPYPNSYKVTTLAPNAAGVVQVPIASIGLPVNATTTTYYMIAESEDIDGENSVATGEISFTMDARVPNPPAGLTVA
jgi:hypothetical protein